MSPRAHRHYSYPSYSLEITPELIDQCCEIGVRLASDVGLIVRHPGFLGHIRGKPGIRIEGERVHIEASLLRRNIEEYRERVRCKIEARGQWSEEMRDRPWEIACGGFSMYVIDAETDEVRPASRQDLRDMIHLAGSLGIGGSYPVMPQDVPPLMRALACFKICFETSDSIQPYDYQDVRQTPFIYEMHRVVGKPFDITLCVPRTMMIDEKDLEIFLRFYPSWKENRDIHFVILDYPMLGITKPITLTGSISLYVAELFSISTLFNLFDPELELPIDIGGGLATDMRNACWAWGSPRQHLMKFLNSQITEGFARIRRDFYVHPGTLLETSSSACDEQAALEKTAVALIAALQGARRFTGAGNLCVDDLFSAVQLIIDREIVDYVQQVVESFTPPKEILGMEGVYELLRDVSLGNDQFLSHPDTVAKHKSIMPPPHLLRREKLASWRSHRKVLKDWAREECLARIKENGQRFHLDEGKQKSLEEIYRRAETALGTEGGAL